LRIFICYASEDRDLARRIHQTLTNDGHDVFIDANSLRVGDGWNEKLRAAIQRTDRFVFLASRHSLRPGAFTLTELDMAQTRWPSPVGVVWPLIADPTIDPDTLPIYLQSVQAHVPKGDPVTELALAIDDSRRVGTTCLAVTAAAIALLAGAAVVGPEAIGPGGAALTTPEQAILMPAEKPDPNDGWMASATAVTLIPVGYTNNGRRDVRIEKETATVALGGRTVGYQWFNEVDIKPQCAPIYLCTTGSLGPHTLPAYGTVTRETMYMPTDEKALPWQAFVAHACTTADRTVDITVTSTTRTTTLVGSTAQPLTTTCRIDVAKMRTWLVENGFCKPGETRVPVRLTPLCE
jgi:hypothetical protein